MNTNSLWKVRFFCELSEKYCETKVKIVFLCSSCVCVCTSPELAGRKRGAPLGNRQERFEIKKIKTRFLPVIFSLIWFLANFLPTKEPGIDTDFSSFFWVSRILCKTEKKENLVGHKLWHYRWVTHSYQRDGRLLPWQSATY